MTTDPRPSSGQITVSGIRVQIERKDIKNLHLGVYPPNGRVRVAVPLVVSDDAVRLAVVGKLGWIRRQQAQFAKQPRQSAREMVNGESHYFLGRRYRLRVHEQPRKQGVAVRGLSTLELFVNAGRGTAQREAVLLRWYRQQLAELIAPVLAQWEQALGVQVSAWGIKRMKTKWGSCNPVSKRVWFNLELAKKPVQCLEYIVAHELAHLLERNHTDQFRALLDRHMPEWKQHRNQLSEQPLAHEAWR
jgi:predicted metal-dependent hydrolase